MDIHQILDYLSQYGIIVMFIIVFLEYLNVPGIPPGIIMPAAGIIISRGSQSFISTLILSIIAGLLGSIILYSIGYFGGRPILDKFCNKFPKSKRYIDKIASWTDKYGILSCFLARLIPVARTLISLTAGTFKCNPFNFILFSIPGIALWNFVFIYAGYAFGDIFLR